MSKKMVCDKKNNQSTIVGFLAKTMNKNNILPTRLEKFISFF